MAEQRRDFIASRNLYVSSAVLGLLWTWNLFSVFYYISSYPCHNLHIHIPSQRPCHPVEQQQQLLYRPLKPPFPILLFPLSARLAVIHPVVVIKCTKEQMETETAVKAYRSRFPINKASSPYESSISNHHISSSYGLFIRSESPINYHPPTPVHILEAIWRGLCPEKSEVKWSEWRPDQFRKVILHNTSKSNRRSNL